MASEGPPSPWAPRPQQTQRPASTNATVCTFLRAQGCAGTERWRWAAAYLGAIDTKPQTSSQSPASHVSDSRRGVKDVPASKDKPPGAPRWDKSW